MRSEDLLEITDTNFDALALRAPLPVLIDFTAAWCAPCRAIAPHIAAIAREYGGRLTVATCDVDANAGARRPPGRPRDADADAVQGGPGGRPDRRRRTARRRSKR